MLIERQLSIFCAGISAALVVPECYPVYMKQAPVSAGPHVGLLIGTALGAIGVFLGILLVAEHLEYADGWGERLRALSMLLAWALFAIGLSAATALVALHAPGLGWRIVLAVDSLAPLTGLMYPFAYRKYLQNREKKGTEQ